MTSQLAQRVDTLAGKFGFWAQVLFVLAYVGILSTAMFVFQFGFGELPCPLCITQRMVNVGDIAQTECDCVCIKRVGFKGQALRIALDEINFVFHGVR